MFVDLVVEGLIDPFRIGLLIALVATMLRTRSITGTLVPLAAGVVFVAVIIPVTIGAATNSDVPIATRVAAGIVSNIVILAVALAALALWQWSRRKEGG